VYTTVPSDGDKKSSQAKPRVYGEIISLSSSNSIVQIGLLWIYTAQ